MLHLNKRSKLVEEENRSFYVGFDMKYVMNNKKSTHNLNEWR